MINIKEKLANKGITNLFSVQKIFLIKKVEKEEIESYIEIRVRKDYFLVEESQGHNLFHFFPEAEEYVDLNLVNTFQFMEDAMNEGYKCIIFLPGHRFLEL